MALFGIGTMALLITCLPVVQEGRKPLESESLHVQTGNHRPFEENLHE